MTRRMEGASALMQMGLPMRASGRKIKNQGWAMSAGLMVRVMMVSTSRDSSTDMANLRLVILLIMWVSSGWTLGRGRANKFFLTSGLTRANGIRAPCMVRVVWFGQMVSAMKGNTRRTERWERESSHGQTALPTKACGTRASRTAAGLTPKPMVARGLGLGSMDHQSKKRGTITTAMSRLLSHLQDITVHQSKARGRITSVMLRLLPHLQDQNVQVLGNLDHHLDHQSKKKGMTSVRFRGNPDRHLDLTILWFLGNLDRHLDLAIVQFLGNHLDHHSKK
mmetsp:Transcript_103403/g.188556  ORF Transcript_103403/g.188556 Transcript_103403/m.188556 type:complete len:279 (+) Transcript_103403:164-1000(+)